jgi:hypothetical protein
MEKSPVYYKATSNYAANQIIGRWTLQMGHFFSGSFVSLELVHEHESD